MMKHLWINAGELSGDVQAGSLLTALRPLAPGLRVTGMGGESLAQAGQENFFRIEDLSVMGLTEVLGSLPRILGLLRRINHKLEAERPDAVLLVDAPEFNFRVAKMASRLGIPVYYFIPPKIWAWRTGRVQFLQRHVQGIFSILPFEVEFYRRHGLGVTYVGNPLVDLVNWPAIKHIRPIPGRIGLMPGSRRKEVETLMPRFARTATLLQSRFPHIAFHCMRAPNFTKEYLHNLWASPVPLVMEEPESRYAFMRTCECILAASGTATLETGLADVPTIVTYVLNPLSYALGKAVVKVPWISLTNLSLGKETFPEHIQADAKPEALAKRLGNWLDNPHALEEVHEDLARLRTLYGAPGTAHRAAQLIWQELEQL